MSTVNSLLNRLSRSFLFVTKSAILIFRSCRTFSLLKRANRTKTTGWLLCSNKYTRAYITHHDVWKNICQKNIVFFFLDEEQNFLDWLWPESGEEWTWPYRTPMNLVWQPRPNLPNRTDNADSKLGHNLSSDLRSEILSCSQFHWKGI